MMMPGICFLRQTWNFSQDIYIYISSGWNCYYTVLHIIVAIAAAVRLLKLVIQSSASTVANPCNYICNLMPII
ncbi:hypothetical protein HYC85_002966 [Camellia sinensis]|uniref:Uncharacterized protein n=1 Tax=Camellia sinensis TaxID=4442 RepID=A0A7J7IAY9_CAMSI|nr:hypothetical protein HYC85_002966 [Camellia sinensis]